MGNNGKYSIGDIVTLKTHPLYSIKEKASESNINADPNIKEDLDNLSKETVALPHPTTSPVKTPENNNDSIIIKENLDESSKTIVASPRTTTPAMIVVEKVKEIGRKLHDINTGKKIASLWKYKCQYYIWKEGVFKETWFDEDIIAKIALAPKSASYNFGEKIVFKAYDYDIAYAKYLQNFKPKGKQPDTIPNLIVPKYAPPYMIMIGHEKLKVDSPIYHTNHRENKEEQIRYLSDYKIKCKWYNPIDCKFSEEWFIPEALISIEEKV